MKQDVAEVAQVAEAPQHHRPSPKPKREPHHKEQRHEKRGSQRQHNEQAARPEAVDKSELPAFLFRPVPVRKPVPQTE